MNICTISGCTKRHEAHGWCDMHYARWKRTGDPLGLLTAERGTAVNGSGYKVFGSGKEHIAVAEKAMGKKLPKGAVVHHVDENRLNNCPTNLVVCTRAYHMVLHARMRAMAACGNPDWIKCTFCGTYSDPLTMWTSPVRRQGYHKECRRERKAALQAGEAVPGARLVQTLKLAIK